MSHSIAELIALLPESERQETMNELLSDFPNPQRAAYELQWDWKFWGRPEQQAPDGDWFAWLLLSGRGFGKTRSMMEWLRKRVQGRAGRKIAIVGETAADVRDVLIEGPSGILAVSPPEERPHWEPSRRRLTWPNGAIATTYSGDKPDQLRGPEHDTAVVDELAKYRYPSDVWDNLSMGLRLGDDPRAAIATTPRPLPIIMEMVDDPDIHVRSGSTFENIGNLSTRYIRRIVRRYEGTRLGRQELHGEILSDVPGALWNRDILEEFRVRPADVPPLVKLGIGLDPPGSEDGAEAGIIAAGLGEDGHAYLLADNSLSGKPAKWGRTAVEAHHEWEGDRIIGERNNGGDMVEHTIRTVDPNVPFLAVWASRGKVRRAEPISALYEQGKVHHVGYFGPLEDQMCTYLPNDPRQPSPDRMDAAVWVLSWLMLGRRALGSTDDWDDYAPGA